MENLTSIKNLKTCKNKLILLEGKFGLLKHCLGERNFQAFKKTFFLHGYLKHLKIISNKLTGVHTMRNNLVAKVK